MRFLRATIGACAVAAVVASAAPVAVAQRGPRCPGHMPGYDPATEVTLKATVEAVEQVEDCCARGKTGTHLTVAADGEKVQVHAGPSFFLEEQEFTLTQGDEIELTGSKVTCMGAEVVLPREIKKGNRTLKLRDERGIPEWSGRRRVRRS